MNYRPSIIDPSGETLKLSEFLRDSEWTRVNFSDLGRGDRVLVFRMYNGVRTITEGVLRKFDTKTDTWENSLGAPLVSILDVHIFRVKARQYR